MFSAIKLVVALYLCIASVCSAPMQLAYLPMQYGMQPPIPFLRQMAPTLQSSPMSPQQQPLLIVVPNAAANPTADAGNLNLNEPIANLKSNTGHVDESKEALVYLPEERRLTLAQLIAINPFLPVEVSVPDEIKKLVNMIFGGLFKSLGQEPVSANTLRNGDQLPVIVMPYSGPVPLNQ